MFRDVKFIVVHCSDSDVLRHDNIETIEQWHKERGFDSIGYHYFITKDGVVHDGRPEYVIGAHVRGYNKNSLGICLSGRHRFTKEQFQSLKILLDHLMIKYNLERFDVLHHRDFDTSKTCPNFNLHDVLSGHLSL